MSVFVAIEHWNVKRKSVFSLQYVVYASSKKRDVGVVMRVFVAIEHWNVKRRSVFSLQYVAYASSKKREVGVVMSVLWHIYKRVTAYICKPYGVASISRMLKNIGLFCKRALQKRPIFCKETYIFKHPINRSHPIGTIGTVRCTSYYFSGSWKRVLFLQGSFANET